MLGPRSIWSMGENDPVYILSNLTDVWGHLDLIDIHFDNDYLVPLLLSNQHYQDFFDRYFPDREVFHPLSGFLFSLLPRYEGVAQGFRDAYFGSFTIGLQIRMHKHLGPGLNVPDVGHFCALAWAVQLRRGLPDEAVRIFVASDSVEAVEAVKRSLGHDKVIHTDAWGEIGAETLTAANNPGSEESALLDMRLLSMTDALIITSASSFGYVAAAWGGIVPMHVLHRGNEPSILNPYFFIPLDTEPCYWGAQRYFLAQAPAEAANALRDNPMWLQYAFCQ